MPRETRTSCLISASLRLSSERNPQCCTQSSAVASRSWHCQQWPMNADYYFEAAQLRTHTLVHNDPSCRGMGSIKLSSNTAC